LSRYEEKLAEVKQEAQKLAKQYIPELYTILRDEESLLPEDCRARIEHDCLGIWAKSTIRKYLPEEAKDPSKQSVVRIANEVKKLKKIAIPSMTQRSSGVGINHTESDSFVQNESQLSSFQNESISRFMMGNNPNSELQKSTIKVMPIRNLIGTNPSQTNGVLLLPHNIAREIFHLVRESGVKFTTNFKLRHNGVEVTRII
jgi:hypothetical protein